MTTWILVYLLVGFAIEWLAVHVLDIQTDNDWKTELAATLLWPLTISVALVVAIRGKR